MSGCASSANPSPPRAASKAARGNFPCTWGHNSEDGVMRLGLNVMRPSIRFGQWGSDLSETAKIVSLAEDLGYHSVWTAEASGTDATTPLAWLAAQTSKIQLGTAIMQIAGRSPGTTAMTAATLDLLSGRRFLLGLGVSGAAVVEAWHNQPY